ncbi:MAG: DNA polymerase I [Bacteroidales bacterium]|nr:DNA polymerase I [Bacteroidales bacterium]
MEKLFLLDAYALIFRAYYAFMRVPRINSKGVNTSAVFGFMNTLNDVITHQQPTHLAVVFDPPSPTFRHEIFADYKAQREETPEVIRYSVPIIKRLLDAYRIPIVQVDGYEADDVIGTMAYRASEQGYDVYMMTPDKDYCQLVGPHRYIFKPKKQGNDCEVWGVEEVKARYGIEQPSQVIDLLGLMGDASDNIPGCPKVGEKRAVEFIQTFGNIDGLLANTDKIKGAMRQTVEDNAEQIKLSRFLATIKTDVPYNFNINDLKRKEPDTTALYTLFQELEFNSQLKKLQQPIEPPIGGLFQQVEKAQTVEADKQDVDTTINVDKFQIVENEEQLQQAVSKITKNGKMTFFTLLSSLEPMKSKMLAMGLQTDNNEGVVVRFTPQTESALLQTLKPIFENQQIDKYTANAKPVVVALKQHNIAVNGTLFDTEVAHYIINADLPHTVESLSEHYLHSTLSALPIFNGRNATDFDQINNATICRIVAERTVAISLLQKILANEIETHNLNTLCYDIEMPLIQVLADMEYEGALIDDFALASLSNDFSVQLSTIEHQIRQYAGTNVNVNSPKQIGELLFDTLKIVDKPRRTKSGQYVTDEETLNSLVDVHPVVPLILQYRGLKKLLSTYIDALPALINTTTGRIHASFNQTVTATGRLSSSNPNLQNIPIRDDNGQRIRQAFIPNDGERFLSADYSQVELRLMAHLSGDKALCAAFKADNDIHAATAAKIFHVDINDVTSDMRRHAKTANFGIIYGISAFGLAERLGVSRGEAAALIDGYFQAFPGVKRFIEQQQQRASEQGYVETLFHRRRQLPDINSHNATVRGFAQRNAVNAPIQGTAADIMKLAMVRLHQAMKKAGLKAKLLVQVHDEVDFTVPVEEIDTLKQIVTEAMEQAVSLSVPLRVDIGIGNNWLEAH